MVETSTTRASLAPSAIAPIENAAMATAKTKDLNFIK
jgi:hypothetical protein